MNRGISCITLSQIDRMSADLECKANKIHKKRQCGVKRIAGESMRLCWAVYRPAWNIPINLSSSIEIMVCHHQFSFQSCVNWNSKRDALSFKKHRRRAVIHLWYPRNAFLLSRLRILISTLNGTTLIGNYIFSIMNGSARWKPLNLTLAVSLNFLNIVLNITLCRKKYVKLISPT